MIKIVTVNPFKVYLKNGPNSDLINVLSPLLMRSCFIGPLPASFSLFSFVQRLTVNKCYTYVKNSYDWIRTANHSANWATTTAPMRSKLGSYAYVLELLTF